ncbi:type II toxin-antitoxin system VapC family toxin [Candidatus Nitrosotenuis aquarius]|uniref:type II toxin-antitoxin system VapC family toxin n=1 Tax=Candidatus Nitrosotenuis aquarius TaxID=1846278 RepID=UPI000C1EA63A|nr:PIN domain-containing protein [Candidatus Nitrosotenuis aquarius]
MESAQTVILDANVIIKEIQEGRILRPIAKRMKKYKSKLVLPEIILGEVSKITGSDPISTMERVYQHCKQPIMVDKTNEILTESQRINEKYYECHRSDSLILATAKLTGSTLVSFDRDLLQTAKMEGVQAFLPRNYIRWG